MKDSRNMTKEKSAARHQVTVQSNARLLFLWDQLRYVQSHAPDSDWHQGLVGRVRARMGLEPPMLPWYSEPGDLHTPAMVGYQRELGRIGGLNMRGGMLGFQNRGFRKAQERKARGPLTELRRALRRVHTNVAS